MSVVENVSRKVTDVLLVEAGMSTIFDLLIGDVALIDEAVATY